jgi:serine/threonine-protein kinase
LLIRHAALHLLSRVALDGTPPRGKELAYMDASSSLVLTLPNERATGAPSPNHGYRIGQLVAGRYRLSQTLSEGSMGAVWLAKDLVLDLPVAVKLVHRDASLSSADRSYLSDRLMREARATTAVRHPAIVRVLDYGVTLSAGAYLVMDQLEGQSLGRRLRRRGRVVSERAVQVLLPIADALAAVHARGIVHRDLKPDNVFLSRDNHGRIQPKVIDFGLAKLAQTPSVMLTGSGVLGTPEYMPPEQVIESSTVDHRADIWGFAVVLYEMLSGAIPFPGRSCPEILRAILDRDVPPLTTMGIDSALWDIVALGLRKDPAERPASISELGQRLADWLTARGVGEDITGASLRTQWPLSDQPEAPSR